jgi:hypothetical protein
MEISTPTISVPEIPRPFHEDVDPSCHTWSTTEALLLIQAVYSYGSENWKEIYYSMMQHPIMKKHRDILTEKACSAMYQQLVKGMEEEKQMETSSSVVPKQEIEQSNTVPITLNMAKKLLRKRLEELNQELASNETHQKALQEQMRKMMDPITHNGPLETYIEQMKKQRDSIIVSKETRLGFILPKADPILDLTTTTIIEEPKEPQAETLPPSPDTTILYLNPLYPKKPWKRQHRFLK